MTLARVARRRWHVPPSRRVRARLGSRYQRSRSIFVPAVPTSTSFRAVPGCDRYGAHSTRHQASGSAISTVMASPNCGAPSPRIWTVCAAQPSTRTTSSSRTALARASGSSPRRSARTAPVGSAVEDPSLDDTQAVIRASGLELTGVPVDDSGLLVEALENLAVDAVVVTAAHQYPTGAVLPPDRRAALVAWAARRNAVIIEDDYDAEFRFDRQPIGAIQGLDPDRVVYAGSASKVLAPGLRLGWLAVPPNLVDAVRQAKKTADQGSPAIEQSDVRRLHRARRARPSPPAPSTDLSRTPGRTSPSSCATSAGRAAGGRLGRSPRVGRGCPTTSRRAVRSPPRRGRGSDSQACPPIASYQAGPAASSLATADFVHQQRMPLCNDLRRLLARFAAEMHRPSGRGEPEGRSGEAERFEDARRPRL